MSNREEGLIVISGSPLSQLNRVSVYKVDPRSYAWSLERHNYTPSHLRAYKMRLVILENRNIDCLRRPRIPILLSADGPAIPESLPFSETGLCIKCHSRWIFLSVTLFSIIPYPRIRIG